MDAGEARQVVEGRDLVAGVHVETTEETMVPQENLWIKATVPSLATPFTAVEMTNSLKDA